MGFFPFGVTPQLQRQASTGVAGFALVNGTPNILTWQVPNDGQVHRVMVFGRLQVTSAETGGQVVLNITDPGGNAGNPQVWPAGQAAGGLTASPANAVVQAGSTVTLTQATALTLGAATLWAELWGS